MAECCCSLARDLLIVRQRAEHVHISLSTHDSLALLNIDLVSKNNLEVMLARCALPHYRCDLRKGSFRDPAARPGSRTRLSSCPGHQNSWSCSRQIPTHSSLRLCRMQRPETGSAPGQPYPIARYESVFIAGKVDLRLKLMPTCIVTCRSSTRTSLVRKSAPIVAL